MRDTTKKRHEAVRQHFKRLKSETVNYGNGQRPKYKYTEILVILSRDHFYGQPHIEKIISHT